MATRGPKRREIDLNEVKLLSSIFCSEEEIAERLGFTYTGFRKRKERDGELVAALKKGRSDAVRSLRALQFQSAKRGNVAMQIWLGKQYLKQSDKAAIEQSGLEGGLIALQHRIDPEHAEEVARRLERQICPPDLLEKKGSENPEGENGDR